MKYTHRLLRSGHGKLSEPVALKFWLRIENDVLEMAADLEPRRWFNCYWSIDEVTRLKGDDAGAILRSAVETAQSDPNFAAEARKNPVLCACAYPFPMVRGGHA